MFVYRLIEKLNLTHITANQTLNYLIVVIGTFAGATIMSFILKKAIEMVEKKN